MVKVCHLKKNVSSYTYFQENGICMKNMAKFRVFDVTFQMYVNCFICDILMNNDILMPNTFSNRQEYLKRVLKI